MKINKDFRKNFVCSKVKDGIVFLSSPLMVLPAFIIAFSYLYYDSMENIRAYNEFKKTSNYFQIDSTKDAKIDSITNAYFFDKHNLTEKFYNNRDSVFKVYRSKLDSIENNFNLMRLE
ncbi:MAG: hypothetical protein ACP5N1_04705 [Candidatus Woesearchaeota archaeon]